MKLAVLLLAFIFIACQPQKEQKKSSVQKNQKNILKAIHLLNSIKLDYKDAVQDGKIKNKEEYEEQHELIEEIEKLIDPRYTSVVGFIKTDIEKKVAASEVEKKLLDLKLEIIRSYQINTIPPQELDLAKAKMQYEKDCMVCHGATGDGKGEGAASLTPKPTNFKTGHRAKHMTAFLAYTTITFGVDETSMQSYSNLSEKERWALAQYVLSFRK